MERDPAVPITTNAVSLLAGTCAWWVGNFSDTVVGRVAAVQDFSVCPLCRMTDIISMLSPRHEYSGDVRPSGFMTLQAIATQGLRFSGRLDLVCRRMVGNLSKRDGPVTRCLFLHTTTQTQKERCHQWNSNSESTCRSDRRQCLSWTAQPFWWAVILTF